MVPGSQHNLIQSCAPLFTVWFWDGHSVHKLIWYKVGELHVQSEVHIFPLPAETSMWEGVSLDQGSFLPSPLRLLVLCFDLWFFLVNVWFIIFIYSFFNCGWIHNTISTSICLKIFYYLLHNFIFLANCWNFEIVIINSSVVNNKFYLFFCICATHFSSKILQNCSISVIHSYNYLKVQSSKLQESLLFDLSEIFWKSNNF